MGPELFSKLGQIIEKSYQKQGWWAVGLGFYVSPDAPGNLRIEVKKGKIGTVGMKKSQYFPTDTLSKSLRANTGDLLRLDSVTDDLEWLNRNPFRKAYAKPIALNLDSDADLLYYFDERNPLRAYVGWNDNGAATLGRDRYHFGIHWGNAFGKDQQLNYNGLLDVDPEEFHAHSLSWIVPMHKRREELSLHAAYSSVDTTLNSSDLMIPVDGYTWHLGAGWNKPLPRWGNWRPEIGLRLDHKTSSTAYAPNLIIGLNQEYRTLTPSLIAKAKRKEQAWELDLRTQLAWNPGGSTFASDDSTFSTFRKGADGQFFKASFQASALWKGPGPFEVAATLAGQWSPDALPSNEQLQLGGMQSIRGYQAISQVGDSGYSMRLELRSPWWEQSWASTEALGTPKARLIGFVDHGYARINPSCSCEKTRGSEEWLGSFGLGLELALADHFNFLLHAAQPFDLDEDIRIHASATIFSF